MQITVNASKKYDIHVKRGLLSECGKIIKDVVNASKAVVITDSNVDKLYSERVISGLQANGFQTAKFVFPAGEQSKNLSIYGEILSFLAKSSTTRGDVLVALGGGVTGDMAGFAAATYMRGIKYVQIPTTLLAAIDSSVGGKTAIDLPEGKNLVGAFCQPEAVIIDIDTFDTLPNEVYDDGLGEMAKYAMLVGGELLELVYDGVRKNIEQLVYLCVDYKRKIVESDEFERGERKLLNLGHTLAHGIEKLSGYTLTHGKAVGIGLYLIARACTSNGLCSQAELKRIIKLLEMTNQSLECPYDLHSLCKQSYNDKKRNGDKITLVTVRSIGDVNLYEMTMEEMEEFLCRQ